MIHGVSVRGSGGVSDTCIDVFWLVRGCRRFGEEAGFVKMLTKASDLWARREVVHSLMEMYYLCAKDERQTDRERGRQAGRQADKQTDR